MRTAILRAFSKSRYSRPDFLPADHKNYNFEEHNEYTKRYAKAIEQRELLVKKLEPDSKYKRKPQIIKEKNRSLENYQVWRDFDVEEDEKATGMVIRVPRSGKLMAKPSTLIQTFGPWQPSSVMFHRATSCLKFRDRNLDTFILTDTSVSKQELIPVKQSVDQIRAFWTSKEEHEFWMYTNQYSEKYRFMRFIKDQIKKFESGELPSFEERMASKFGKANLYDDHTKDYEVRKVPLIYRHSRSEFLKVGKSEMEFIEDSVYDKKIERPELIESLEGYEKY